MGTKKFGEETGKRRFYRLNAKNKNGRTVSVTNGRKYRPCGGIFFEKIGFCARFFPKILDRMELIWYNEVYKSNNIALLC